MSPNSFDVAARPCFDSRYCLSLLIGHFMPVFSSYFSFFFWIATFVRCMYKFFKFALSRVYLEEEKRQNPPLHRTQKG